MLISILFAPITDTHKAYRLHFKYVHVIQLYVTLVLLSILKSQNK